MKIGRLETEIHGLGKFVLEDIEVPNEDLEHFEDKLGQLPVWSQLAQSLQQLVEIWRVMQDDYWKSKTRVV